MENPNGILHFLMFVGTRKAGPSNAGVIKCPVDKWGPTKTNSLCGERRRLDTVGIFCLRKMERVACALTRNKVDRKSTELQHDSYPDVVTIRSYSLIRKQKSFTR